MKPKTLLCFDYGAKRIGVAVGQTLTRTATPLETLHTRKNKPDWDRITHLIHCWRPQALIIGHPLNMDGTHQEITAAAERFSRQLSQRYNLPVYKSDERLSSFEARQRLTNTRNLDPVAAQIILESWLAEQLHDHRKESVNNSAH